MALAYRIYKYVKNFINIDDKKLYEVSETPVLELQKQVENGFFRLQLDGTTFIIHEDARQAFHSKTEQFLTSYLRDAYVRERLEKAKKWLEIGYECIRNGSEFYVLGPKLEKMEQLRTGRRLNREEIEMLCSNLYGASSLGSGKETRLPE